MSQYVVNVTRWGSALAAIVLAAALLPAAAGAQSEPETAETESAVPETEESAVEALGGVVVLDGTVTFGSGVSGASGGSGFAGYSRGGGGGIGSLEVSSVDGTVFGDASQVYALAQIAGAVDVGPAVGTTDAAVLTVLSSVDLSDGFWLVVGDHLLSSDGATVPVGELNSTGGLRYWLWNAPCKDWELDDTVPVSIVTFGEDPAARWADTSLGGLGLTGATLDAAFDPATLSYAATAPVGSEQVTIDASAPLACDLDISPADADAGAEGHQVDLGDDGAQVTVTVTAPDGSTTGQYSVQIARETAEDEGQQRSQAEVQSIVVDAVPDLEFSPSQTRHEATVPPGTTSTEIDAVPAEGTETDAWTVTAGDEQSTPVDADGTVTLTPGADTLVAVRSSTEHNESQRIYTVRLTTPPAADPPPQQGTRSETRQLSSRHPDSPADTWRSSSTRSVTGGWHKDTLGGWGDHTHRSSNSNGNNGNSNNGDAAPQLSGLTVEPGTLDPAFAAGTHEYDVAVAHGTDQITVNPTAAAGTTTMIGLPDADAGTDGHQVALNAPQAGKPAQTAILITVTAGTRMDSYTVTVTRAAAPAEQSLAGPRQNPPQQSSDATLSGLSVDAGALYPAFASATAEYTLLVDSDVATVTVTPTANHTDATTAISVGGQTATGPISLSDGLNEVTVTVTAQDTTTTRTYTLGIIRTAAAATDHTGFLQIDTGWDHVCGLRMDHTLACKVDANINNWSFERNVPEGMFEGVGVKRFAACGTRANGELLCWDGFESGVYLTGVDTARPTAAAESGTDRCALLASGDIGCLPGVNHQVISGPFTAAVSARDAVCGLRTDGLIRCWTTSSPGLISTTQHRDYPIDPMGTAYPDTVFKFVAAGYNQACGIRASDNAALCWRWDYDQLGYAFDSGVRAVRTTPGEYKFVDPGIGEEGCGVLIDGTVNCWGGISSNAPGESTIGYESATIEWRILACGLRTDRSMHCWNASTPPSLAPVSPWRGNSKLLGLGLEDTATANDVALSASFRRDTTAYTATVSNSVDSVTVVPELTNSLAEYAVYSDTDGAAGSDNTVELAVGQNVINVRVVSADRASTTTYTITVTRQS